MKANAAPSATKYFLIITLSAMVVRLIFLFQFQSSLLFDHHIVDMSFYNREALALLNGENLIDGPFFRAPFYSYFIAALYYIGGKSDWIFRIVQIILGSLSCGLLYLIGRIVFSHRIALIAGLFMALCGSLIFYDVMLLATSLVIFLNLLALFFLIRYFNSKNISDLIFAGLAIGLSAITRPNILFFALVLFIWAVIALLRKKDFIPVKSLIVLALGIIIPILPVTIHNYNKSGEFILIGAYGGINLYIGNYQQADGVSPIIPGVRKDWWGGYEDTRRMAETASGKKLSASEVSDFWVDKTFTEIKDDPAHFAGLIFKKIVLLASGVELSNNFDYYFFTRQSTLMKILIWPKFIFFPWGLIFPLGLLGMLAVRKYQNGSTTLLIFIGMYALSIIMFLVSARYRLPLLPVLILFAAFWVDDLINEFKAKKPGRVIATLIIAVILIILGNYDYFGYGQINYAHGYHTSATIYLQQGKISQAEDYYQKALEADPNLSETINDYAMLMANTDRPREAFKMLIDGYQKFPDDPTINYNLGFLYLSSNQPREALPFFMHSLEYVPDNLSTLNNLGLAYLRLNELDSAYTYFTRAITIEPRFESAYYNLALLEKTRQNYQEALNYYYRIKQISPGNFSTDYLLGLTYLEFDQKDSASLYLHHVLNNMPAESTEYQRTAHLLDSLSLR